MEKNIQELLKDKEENIVQFNLVNNTSNDIYVDLFSTSTLTPTPVTNISIPATYPIVQSIGTVVSNSSVCSAICTTNNSIYYGASNNNVYVYDISTYSTLSVITLAGFVGSCFSISYCSTNNSMYVTENSINSSIAVIDCNTNLVTYIPLLNVLDTTNYTVYNPNNNTLYVGITRAGSSLFYFIDCSTNIITPSPLIAFSPYFFFSEVTNNNFIYFYDGVNMQKIDCTSNTINLISIPLSLGSVLAQLTYNPSNNNIYVSPQVTSNNMVVYNTVSDSVLTNISFGTTFPFISTLNTTTNQLIVTLNTVTAYEVGIVDCNFNTLVQIINYGSSAGSLTTANYISTNGYVWLGDSITPTSYLITNSNFTVIPYYVSGSSNYNTFVNNLNNEPIAIQMIRFFAQNQNQLTNQVQLTTIDSSGFQTFEPNFPINQVSAYQQQGNIGEVELKDIIFDGRTYINQYKLNANETISFEIIYKQLNINSATKTYPIFFKPKVQLKEYLKEDYSDYEIDF